VMTVLSALWSERVLAIFFLIALGLIGFWYLKMKEVEP